MASSKYNSLCITELNFSTLEPNYHFEAVDLLKIKGVEEYMQEQRLSTKEENAMIYIAGL